MREIERTGQFKRDYKREKKTDSKLDDALAAAIALLAADKPLPEKLSDHRLSGQWKGYRECHIKPDLLLIYEKPKGKLSLVRLGSHSELFG